MYFNTKDVMKHSTSRHGVGAVSHVHEVHDGIRGSVAVFDTCAMLNGYVRRNSMYYDSYPHGVQVLLGSFLPIVVFIIV